MFTGFSFLLDDTSEVLIGLSCGVLSGENK
jgi:hypothetical protein